MLISQTCNPTCSAIYINQRVSAIQPIQPGPSTLSGFCLDKPFLYILLAYHRGSPWQALLNGPMFFSLPRLNINRLRFIASALLQTDQKWLKIIQAQIGRPIYRSLLSLLLYIRHNVNHRSLNLIFLIFLIFVSLFEGRTLCLIIYLAPCLIIGLYHLKPTPIIVHEFDALKIGHVINIHHSII